MRIGIDFRMLTTGSILVQRGTGRYIQQALREVLAQDSKNEYLLLCDEGVDTSAILPAIRSAPNARTVFAPKSLNRHHDPIAYSRAYDQWLGTLKLDLLHATIPLTYDRLNYQYVTSCPIVGTIYDLIPLMYPEFYLKSHPRYEKAFDEKLASLNTVQHIIAISQSAAQDTVRLMGFEESELTIAYPVAEPFFRKLQDTERQSQLQQLQARLAQQNARLPSQYLYSLVDVKYNKNVATLLAAYANLPNDVRQHYPLVIGGYANRQTWIVERLIRKFGIADNVVFLGYISDEELNTVFNCATIVIHASRYEGFGMPVLEAMCCGAPVITTTASSLPEVVGDAALLVDPDDAGALTIAINDLLADPLRREVLGARGLVQAQRFSPEQLGSTTLHAYQIAASQPAGPRERSLPPLRSEVPKIKPLPQATELHARVLSALSDADGAMLQTEALHPSRKTRLFHVFKRIRNLGLVFDTQRNLFHTMVNYFDGIADAVALLSKAENQPLQWHQLQPTGSEVTIGVFTPLASDPTRQYSAAAALMTVLSTGATFVDVGAQAGFLALIAAQRVGSGGRVICIEDDLAWRHALTLNLASAPYPERITTLAIRPAAGTVGGLYQALRLDDVLHNLASITALHIAERLVTAATFDGLSATVTRQTPTVLVDLPATRPMPDWLQAWSARHHYAFIREGELLIGRVQP